MKSLRQACIERGIDPDKPGFKMPRPLFNWVDRIIPGVPDSESPSMWWARMRPGYQSPHARQRYSREKAIKDATWIAQSDNPVAAYVNEFERLNNLKGAAS